MTTVYQEYGITETGAVVVVRPDGYVGVTAALRDMQRLDKYFSRFLI